MIKIKNLSLEYPERFGLFIDKLEVKEGDILSVIGPNGAGKTTFLNIIAMFDKPKAGDVEILGQSIFNGKGKLCFRRGMSFVFSRPYLLNRTVYENVCLPLKLRGIADTAAASQMLEIFKIGHLKNSNALGLSQGESHRVALARAFVTKPKLVLLDEPFLSLDERYKYSLINELRKIIKFSKITAIFVSQDQSEVLSLADTIVVMKDGRILQQGIPQDIFTKPASKEVADFVGVETIIEGVVTKKQDNLCFIKATDKILEAVSIYNADDNVFVCIRPEDVIISTQQIEGSSARNHFRAKVSNIQPWGLGYKIGLDCGFNLIAFVTAQSVESLNLETGEEVFASFKATAVHLILRQ